MAVAKKAAPKAKERSPNYPALPLSECIAQVLKIYNAEKRTVVAPVSVARALGYGSLSGASRSVIAALRQFGLLENVGDGLRVSDLAIDILHNPAGSEERAAALTKSAMTPPLIAELLSTHAEASPESLRAYLITKRKFAPEGAGRFVESFRDALNYIGDARPEPVTDESGGTLPPPGGDASRSGRTPPPLAGGKGKSIMQFGWPLSGQATATLTVTGDFDKDDVDTLETYLGAARKALLKAAQARAEQQPAAPSTGGNNGA